MKRRRYLSSWRSKGDDPVSWYEWDEWVATQTQYDQHVTGEHPPLHFRVEEKLCHEVAEWAGQYGTDWRMWSIPQVYRSYGGYGGGCVIAPHGIIELPRADYFMFYFVFADEIARGETHGWGKHNCDSQDHQGIELLVEPDDDDLYPETITDEQAEWEDTMEYGYAEDEHLQDWKDAQLHYDIQCDMNRE